MVSIFNGIYLFKKLLIIILTTKSLNKLKNQDGKKKFKIFILFFLFYYIKYILI